MGRVGEVLGDGRERDPLLLQCFPSVPAYVIPTGAHPDAPKTRVLETREEMDAAQTHLIGGGGFRGRSEAFIRHRQTRRNHCFPSPS